MHGPKSCRLVSGEVEGNIVITGVTQKNCQNQKRHDPNAFSRVVVPMALKQVSTKPGPCPASSGPRACLAPAPGMTRRRRQGLATGTGFRVTSLRLGSNMLSFAGCGVTWRERRIQLLSLANLACPVNSCHVIVEIRSFVVHDTT